MGMKQRDASQMKIWDEFESFMSERGYRVVSHNDQYMGRGSTACKDDKFVPIFNLHVWGGSIVENFVSILVEDRNGNAILGGPAVAIYSMPDTGDSEKNRLVFSKMLNDAYEKYGGYSKSNRLDFAFNEMKEDRRVYDESCLALEAKGVDPDAPSKNNDVQKVEVPVVTTIYFTTTEGPDATQFDTQDVGELLELFHVLLVESGLKLVSVDGVVQDVDRELLAYRAAGIEAGAKTVDEKLSDAAAKCEALNNGVRGKEDVEFGK